MSILYVIVITQARGMYGIYFTEARGREAARGLRAINAMHPECTCYNYFISRGTATMATNFKTKKNVKLVS